MTSWDWPGSSGLLRKKFLEGARMLLDGRLASSILARRLTIMLQLQGILRELPQFSDERQRRTELINPNRQVKSHYGQATGL